MMSSETTPPDEKTADGTGSTRPDDPAEVLRQRDEYLEQLQRTKAEFVNYQRRSKEQAEKNLNYAVSGLAGDLLGVLDNFERALDAARGTGASAIVDGLELVHRQLLGALAKHGIEPISAVGQPFDPNQHEALAQQPSGDHPAGTVVAELGRGYRLKDRVLRPSKVAVSVKPE